jgi:hypothetical protein
VNFRGIFKVFDLVFKRFKSSLLFRNSERHTGKFLNTAKNHHTKDFIHFQSSGFEQLITIF